MNELHILAETADTVTISRTELDALIAAVEDIEDMASVRAWNAFVKDAGDYKTALAYSYSAEEAKRMIAGESPIRIWREKRDLTQRSLAEMAGIQTGYLSEIESGKKPGSLAAHAALARALDVPLEYLVDA